MKNQDYLMHYGVQGMRWGFRKRRVSSGVRRPRGNRSKNMSRTTKSRASINRSRKISSSNIKQRLKNLDKQKIKAVAKTVAVTVGKTAVVAALGTLGGALLINTIDSWTNVSNNIGSTITSSSNLATPTFKSSTGDQMIYGVVKNRR